METRNCQNCKKDFNIEPDDFSFYEKMKVPAPTFCMDCRRQRRFSYRNTHSLYKRKDSFSGKDIISVFSPDKNLVVIDQNVWWGDSWDPFDYGIEYDFSRPFFVQWKEFRDTFPQQSMSNSKAVNSDYCNVAEENYDSYLCSASWKVERSFYSDSITDIKDSSDLQVVHRTEFSYEDINCADSYKLFYSQNSFSCTDSYFLYDCHGCTNCFMSTNLRNKSYYFNNEQLSKEEYATRFAALNMGSFSDVEGLKKQFEILKENAVHRFAHIVSSINSTGDNIDHGKNALHCYDASGGIEDSKDIFWAAKGVKDSYSSGPGIGMANQVYESFDAGAGGGSLFFSNVVYYSQDAQYSFYCFNCVSVFGCFGLRNKKYCIFNKQYTKEEYGELVVKIKQHMIDMPYIDRKGKVYSYGEFFPVDFSPFAYNETLAQDFYPLTKEKALELGFSWRDMEIKNYVPTVHTNEIPDSITDITDSITGEIIECAHKGKCADRCSTAFKIIPDELTFYRRFNIPLPRLCYGCRHYARLHKRNPMKLWHRSCMCTLPTHGHDGKCVVAFETSYAPDRPEIVYCESCYQKEVL
jgi:hypothetical protein